MSARERGPLSLFEGYGIELEYMVVDAQGLDVAPIVPELLADATGEPGACDVERGKVAWSNELAAHVVELKTNGPAPTLEGLAAAFQADVDEIEHLLARRGARLLPGAMHPWMDPKRETRLFPGEYNEVYRTFDRIFDCRHHGWGNLQSTHINLPFANDEEFARLHAAVRVALPILPALAASSPVMDGAPSGFLDNRMRVYRGNARRVPQVSGHVVPEPMGSRAQYEGELLGSIFAALEPHDPEGVLRHEWANARGAIARFDRMAIEIRILDIQECPLADLAVVQAVVALVRGLMEGRFGDPARFDALATETLAAELWRTVDAGERARIESREYLESLGWRGAAPEAGELWRHVLERCAPIGGAEGEALGVLLAEGPLARRLERRLGPSPSRAELTEVYGELADCLRDGRLLRA